jgi:phosphotriesterase-related protein
VTALVEAGWGGRILLSQDVCLASHLEACGGSGYSFILRVFLDRLQGSGVPREVCRAFVTDNPARALSGA